MKRIVPWGCILIALSLGFRIPLTRGESARPRVPTAHRVPCDAARSIGRIASDRLVECSGMDVSMAADDLLWAINDGGHGLYVYALGGDGRDRGRFRISGAVNRDWEGMDTFIWQAGPMILLADIGDNARRHATHRMIVVAEPRLDGEHLPPSRVVDVGWQLDFAYPDGPHDPEGAAVDVAAGEILILTKRDTPPLLFALPLVPAANLRQLTARRLAPMDRIPPPTMEDLNLPYGHVRSHPTGLDLSRDSQKMVVLTYTHAYLFDRRPDQTRADAVRKDPVLVRLPLPQDGLVLHQREAICFSRYGTSLLVASEGRGSGIFEVALGSPRSPPPSAGCIHDKRTADQIP